MSNAALSSLLLRRYLGLNAAAAFVAFAVNVYLLDQRPGDPVVRIGILVFGFLFAVSAAWLIVETRRRRT